MKRFKFRFETVEKVRIDQEKIAMRALSDAQRAYAAEVERKKGLIRDLDESLARREQLAQIPTSIIAYRTEQDFIVGTKQRIIQSDHALIRERKKVEKMLRIYLYARRQRMVIEKLRERDFNKYKREIAKQTESQLRDLYIMRARAGGDVG
ncbi:MAG: flagellar export protein FliJ [Bacteriovoracia bacterium]